MKRAAQLCRGSAEFRGDVVQANDLVFAGGPQQLRGALHQRDPRLLLLQTTAPARPLAVAFGFLRRPEELCVFATGAARRASGPAIDMRGAHGKHEFSVGAQIPLQRGAPKFRGGLRRDGIRCGIADHEVHAPRLRKLMIAIYPLCGVKQAIGRIAIIRLTRFGGASPPWANLPKVKYLSSAKEGRPSRQASGKRGRRAWPESWVHSGGRLLRRRDFRRKDAEDVALVHGL